MSNSILYYPTIEFRHEDYQWLWQASLFWDKIYRIVPPGYELNEPRNIKAICSTEEIGIPISPVKYAKKASEEFSDFMCSNHFKAAALSLVDDEETEYIRIHSSKMDVKLLKDIFYKIKQIDEDDNWLYANPNTVNFYMTFLANHIAKKNSLSLYTRNQELWTTSTYFLYDGDMQDGYYPTDDYVDPSAEALISFMIPDVFPQNILDVPPKDILRFREKRKDERALFMSAIDNLRTEIQKADAPEILKEVLHTEKQKIDKAVNEYKKSMDILKVISFGGVLTTALTIGADVLGYANNIPDLYQGIVGSSGLWVGLLTGLARKRNKRVQNPYTYLGHIKRSFSLYPNSDRIFANAAFWEQYNYTLYRGFEEFIND